MKHLIAACLALALGLSACASDTTNSDIGETIADLASEAQTLANDAGLDAQLANAVRVVSDNAATVGLAATGGEVTDGDVASLIGALDDFEGRIEEARQTLDPEVQDRLDGLASDLREAVEQLNS